jgi:D-arginine dehydrogenase
VQRYDIVVIGGGIAGVSVGYELAEAGSVCLLEMEDTLAYHTTGRSAATLIESYGGPAVRALTSASRGFLESAELFESPVVKPLPVMWLASPGRADAVAQLYAQVRELVPSADLIDGAEAQRLHPALTPGYTELAMLEPHALELDVHTIHQGYARGLRRRGGVVRTRARVAAAQRVGSAWRLRDAAGGEYEAGTVVNAAGAWCDEVARIFGIAPIGIQPLLRSMFLIGGSGVDPTGLPLITDIDSTFMMKPEGTGFLCSPTDELPSPPVDAKPDEIEIARALDAINAATTLAARHVRSTWGGLRNFVADREPVVGYAAEIDGYFWYAGQGGYGIQAAAALARTGAALFAGKEIPPDVAANGLTDAQLAPDRPAVTTPVVP